MDKARILVVEDQAIVAQDIARRLRKLGHEVVDVVSTGEAAVQRALELRPDILLMDIKLGAATDGIDVVKHIRQRLDLPVIYLTGYADEATVARARETGPLGYLVKPFSERELQATLEMALYRHQMEERLRENAEGLRRRTEELDAFAHTVAHDIQGPVNTILNYAQLLLETYGPGADQELSEGLQLIARTAQKVANIVNELMLLAGLREVKAVLTVIDTAALVAGAMDRLSDMIADTNARIHLPSTWPPALGYGPWVEEVWVNYLSNAIKYGGRPPVIELGAEVQPGGMVRFWVQDNGPGINPEEQARLFEPFTRLETARATGVGLGLSIVRRIVERLGGQVAVESEGRPGRGCTFSFTLPGLEEID